VSRGRPRAGLGCSRRLMACAWSLWVWQPRPLWLPGPAEQVARAVGASRLTALFSRHTCCCSAICS